MSSWADLEVLVDARNVLRSRWPNMPEAEVVRQTSAWAAREGARAVVVFDGRAPVGDRSAPGGADVRVIGSGRRSADDWIAAEAARLAAAGVAYGLVTSDRGLKARAAGAAAMVCGGGAFVRILEALDP